MKDRIDILNEEREQRLVREIREELRRGRVLTATGFTFFVVVVLLHAFGMPGDTDTLPLLIGIGVMLIAAGRTPQRDRLLKKAAEKLSAKD